MQATQVVEFERQLAGVACTARAWAKVPVAPSAEQRSELKARVKRLLVERSAVLLAHYYVEPDIQDLAEETGGCRDLILWVRVAVPSGITSGQPCPDVATPGDPFCPASRRPAPSS